MQAESVLVYCESGDLGGKFGLPANAGPIVALSYASKVELASVLTTLQGLGIPFVSAGPPSPSDVFEFLRGKGLVTGRVRGISWRGPGDPVLDDA